jgi:hypothetical protein
VEEPAHRKNRPPPAFGGYTHFEGPFRARRARGCNSAGVWRR